MIFYLLIYLIGGILSCIFIYLYKKELTIFDIILCMIMSYIVLVAGIILFLEVKTFDIIEKYDKKVI